MSQQPLVAVLAIDGGNSKTDVALVRADGAVLAVAHGPGSNPQVIGLDAALAVLDDLVARALAQAGVASVAGVAGVAAGEGPFAAHTAAYLSGIDVPQEEAAMLAALRPRGWSVTTTVANDTFAIFRAGATNSWGVGVVAGAGINAVGIAPDGRTAGFLAIDDTTGDFGGGLGLSRKVMWHAIRAEDGRGEPTSLRGAVIELFGRPSVRDVAIARHLHELTDDDLLALTPVLFAHAAAGDAIARSLVDLQAREVAFLAKSAMARLDLLDTRTELVLGGGLLTARDPLLTRLVDEWLEKEAPNTVVRINDVPAIAGAALLGLDHLRAGAQAEETLRAAFRAGKLCAPPTS